MGSEVCLLCIAFACEAQLLSATLPLCSPPFILSPPSPHIPSPPPAIEILPGKQKKHPINPPPSCNIRSLTRYVPMPDASRGATRVLPCPSQRSKHPGTCQIIGGFISCCADSCLQFYFLNNPLSECRGCDQAFCYFVPRFSPACVGIIQVCSFYVREACRPPAS